MTIYFVILTAITPAAWLLWIFTVKTVNKPEPTKWLVKAFIYGVLSVFLSFVVSIPTSMKLGWDIDKQTYSSF